MHRIMPQSLNPALNIGIHQLHMTESRSTCMSQSQNDQRLYQCGKAIKKKKKAQQPKFAVPFLIELKMQEWHSSTGDTGYL